MKRILIIPMLLLSVAAFSQQKSVPSAQAKQPAKPLLLTITNTQVDFVISKLDSVTAVIVRGEMPTLSRNWTVDKINEARVFLLENYFKQNPPKQDTTKAK